MAINDSKMCVWVGEKYLSGFYILDGAWQDFHVQIGFIKLNHKLRWQLSKTLLLH